MQGGLEPVYFVEQASAGRRCAYRACFEACELVNASVARVQSDAQRALLVAATAVAQPHWIDSDLPDGFSSWADGQPDNLDNTREECVVLVGGEWYDERCGWAFGCVCQEGLPPSASRAWLESYARLQREREAAFYPVLAVALVLPALITAAALLLCRRAWRAAVKEDVGLAEDSRASSPRERSCWPSPCGEPSSRPVSDGASHTTAGQSSDLRSTQASDEPLWDGARPSRNPCRSCGSSLGSPEGPAGQRAVSISSLGSTPSSQGPGIAPCSPPPSPGPRRAASKSRASSLQRSPGAGTTKGRSSSGGTTATISRAERSMRQTRFDSFADGEPSCAATGPEATTPRRRSLASRTEAGRARASSVLQRATEVVGFNLRLRGEPASRVELRLQEMRRQASQQRWAVSGALLCIGTTVGAVGTAPLLTVYTQEAPLPDSAGSPYFYMPLMPLGVLLALLALLPSDAAGTRATAGLNALVTFAFAAGSVATGVRLEGEDRAGQLVQVFATHTSQVLLVLLPRIPPYRHTPVFAADLALSAALLLVAALPSASMRRTARACLLRLSSRGEAQQAAAVAALVGGRRPAALLRMATANFRALPSARLLEADLRHNSDAGELAAKSEGATLGRVDVFVSHSWRDAPKPKFAAIQQCCHELEGAARRPRSCLLWLDKACIDQDDIERSLACLPIFLAGCAKLLVLAGPTYVERLWCVVEVYTFLRMGGSLERVSVVPTLEASETKTAGEKEQELYRAFAAFDVRRAQCSKPDDRVSLLAAIELGFGAFSEFNAAVRRVFDARLSTPVVRPGESGRAASQRGASARLRGDSRSSRRSAPSPRVSQRFSAKSCKRSEKKSSACASSPREISPDSPKSPKSPKPLASEALPTSPTPPTPPEKQPSAPSSKLGSKRGSIEGKSSRAASLSLSISRRASGLLRLRFPSPPKKTAWRASTAPDDGEELGELPMLRKKKGSRSGSKLELFGEVSAQL